MEAQVIPFWHALHLTDELNRRIRQGFDLLDAALRTGSLSFFSIALAISQATQSQIVP